MGHGRGNRNGEGNMARASMVRPRAASSGRGAGVWLLCLLLTPACAWAQAPTETPPGAVQERPPEEGPEGTPEEGPEQQGMIDTAEDVVASSVVGLARWVDAFFDDPNYTEEEADARLEVRLIATDSLENAAEFRARTRFRVNLPRLSRRANLVFEGNEDDDILDPAEVDFDDAVDDSLDNPSLGIQYFERITDRMNLSWTAGIRTSSASLFFGPRVRYQTELSGDSLARFTQRIRWYTEEGWQSDTRLDYDRRLPDGFFRQLVALRWREDRSELEGVRINLSSSVTRPLSEKSALRYAWTTQYPTRPGLEDRETALSVGYRQRFWRDWIALQITPFLRWEQRNDWTTNPGIQFSLTFAFESETSSERPDLITEDFDVQ